MGDEDLLEIARLCGFLPLALRAAGSLLANSPDLSPAQYARDLQDEQKRLERIGKEGVDLDVESSLGLSYSHLPAETASVFRRLSVFPADFDTAAEEMVCRDEGHRHLSELVRLSLVEYQKPSGESEGRYHLHDLVQLFDARRLEEEGSKAPSNDLFQRHAEYFRDVLSLATGHYENADTLGGLRIFDLERMNIESSWAWAKKSLAGNNAAASLCNAFLNWPYLLGLRMHPKELISWLEIALAAARQLQDRSAEGAHLGNLGLAYFDLGEPRKAIEYNDRALKIAREIGDRRGEGIRLGNLGIAYKNLGEPRKAIDYYDQALKIAREIGNRRGEGANLGNLGLAYFQLGETSKAIEYHEQALKIARKIGDRLNEGNWLGNLGIAYKNLGEPRKAIEYYQQQMKITQEIGDRRGEGNSLFNMSLALDGLGKRSEAVKLAKEARAIFEKIESPAAEKVRQKLAEWQG